MIPKKIHYCWFGGNPKSEIIQFCMNSWEKHLPDYEVVEWNENNFDLQSNAFVAEAYRNRKWAHVTDYVRAYALFHQGGIYLDTDVEIRGSLDPFLQHGAFSGFEKKGLCFTALWASQAGHHWPKAVLDSYANKVFTLEPNTNAISEMLEERYGIDPENDSLQVYNNDIYIYPSNYFCLDITNIAVHHFEGSWLNTDKERKTYKQFVQERYIIDNFVKMHSDPQNVLDLVVKEYRISNKMLLRYCLNRIRRRFSKSF